VADALAHMHKKGLCHCNLKSNNIVVSNGKEYFIHFGKACSITSPSAKKYQKITPILHWKCSVDHHAVSRVMFSLWELKINIIQPLAAILILINYLSHLSVLGKNWKKEKAF